MMTFGGLLGLLQSRTVYPLAHLSRHGELFCFPWRATTLHSRLSFSRSRRGLANMSTAGSNDAVKSVVIIIAMEGNHVRFSHSAWGSSCISRVRHYTYTDVGTADLSMLMKRTNCAPFKLRYSVSFAVLQGQTWQDGQTCRTARNWQDKL